MKITERVKRYYGLLVPFARLWQDYDQDNSRGKYIDFWQWAYKHSERIEEALAAVHKEVFKEGKQTYVVPKEIDTHHFIPTIEGEWGVFALPLDRCGFCHKLMMPKLKGFEASSTMSQEGQMRAAGLVYSGDNEITSTDVCEECVAAGKIRFTCVFCEEVRGSDLYHDSEYGDPICKICYEGLSAKEWDAKMEALQESHRWDYSS